MPYLQPPFHLLSCPASMQTFSTCGLDLTCGPDLDVVGTHAFDFLSDLPEPCANFHQSQDLSLTLRDFDNNFHTFAPDRLAPVRHLSSEETFTIQQPQDSRAEVSKIANRRYQQRFRQKQKACCLPHCFAPAVLQAGFWSRFMLSTVLLTGSLAEARVRVGRDQSCPEALAVRESLHSCF